MNKIILFPGIRGKLIHRLLHFLIRRRIGNRFILKFFFSLYVLLNWQRYTNTHKDENAHFVPQFILKNFRIGSTGLIYEYCLGRPVRQASIRKTAVIQNFYTFKDKQKSQSDFIEKELYANLLEKYTPAILEKIENKNLPLTQVEESILTAFVASLFARTPKFKKQLLDLIHLLLVEHRTDPQKLKDKTFLKEVFIDNVYDLSPKRALRFVLESKTSIKADSIALSVSLRLTEMINEMLHSKHLTFFQVEEPEFLFISDNPVIALNIEDGIVAGPMIWGLSHNSLIALPFSPHTAVIYSDRSIDLESDRDKLFIYKALKILYPLNRHKALYSDRMSDVLIKASGARPMRPRCYTNKKVS